MQAGTGDTAAADLASDLSRRTVITGAGSGSANFQIGAFASDAISVSFGRVDISASSMAALETALTSFNTNFSTATAVTSAQTLITAIDAGIGIVNSTRANLGAYQNRLEHTINSLGAAIENLSASESRIRDADVAEETSNMVTAQILTQAGTSVLSQANQAPQGALSLLRG